MKITSLLFVSFTLLSFLAPGRTLADRVPSTTDRHVRERRNSTHYGGPYHCKLSDAEMPEAPTPLPDHDPMLELVHIAVGRGVQNYTCANATSASTPVSIGAMANLYNVSYAACWPGILSRLPGLALQIPFPSTALPYTDLSGIHFFATNTTPVFNLDHLGVVVGKKIANSTAPPTSIKGVDGAGHGAVAWLKITAINGTVGNVRNVYRLDTAGGSPPETCLGMPPVFSIPYSASYWFFGNSSKVDY